MQISVIIRTLNEALHLNDLLTEVRSQEGLESPAEVIIVDSGSDDGTLDIAARHTCRVEHIEKSQFSFGRSLNMGCAAASGEVLVFVSGHCVPASRSWLADLIGPLERGSAAYTYGRQIGAESTKFSETQIFEKYFPDASVDPQDGFFCNNANSALLRSAWERYRFDETLTGLEDMELAKRLIADTGKVSYISAASVFHLHDESWSAVKNRYEREAIALQKIMPEVHFGKRDIVRYFVSAVLHDLGAAVDDGVALRKFIEILSFRAMQYWGSYKGNHEHRRLSRAMKEHYFYPK